MPFPKKQSAPLVTADPNVHRDLAFNAKRGKPFGKKAPAQKALTAPKTLSGRSR